MTSATPEPPSSTPPRWPHCGHGATAADPVGCRGVRVGDHTACLAHLDGTDRDAYLASLAPGTDIDHRGTTITPELLDQLLTALHDPATDTSHIGNAYFEGATFTSETIFSSVTFSGDARFDTATFTGDAWFDEVNFSGISGWFMGVTFSGEARFEGSTFRAAGFAGAVFSRDTQFEGVTFSGEARFEEATFTGEARFEEAVFTGDAWFNRAIFTGGVKFKGSTFSGDALFGVATFTGDARFNRAAFAGDAWFEEATFTGEARFEEATFTGEARFYEATFNSDTRFEGSTFTGKALFYGAKSSGETRFDRVIFEGKAQFSEVIFSHANFGEASFLSDAEFIEATFAGTSTWFGAATFAGDARFGVATFTGDAWFKEATFTGGAWFSRATFSSDAGFDAVTFTGNVDFSEARFEISPRLGPLVCAKRVVLDGAVFGQPVTLEIVAREVRCARTRWASTATVHLRYAEVDLRDAVLEYPVVVAARPTLFPLVHRDGPLAETELSGQDPGVRLTSLGGVDAAHLALHDIDLGTCRFAGTVHLDQLKVDGWCTFAPTPTGWSRRFPWRWSRRITLAEEHYWRACTTRHPGHARGWTPPPEGAPALRPAAVAALYRQLRKSLEDGKNEPGAAHFYYGECEMRRRDTDGTPWSERALLAVYWALSGYGLRASRALAWLGAAMAATVAVMVLWGLPTDAPKPTVTGRQVAVGQEVTWTTDTPDPVNPAGPWSERVTTERFEKALRVVINSVVFRSSGQDLTTAGTYTEMTSRLTEPVLLGLAVLAIRSRIKR